jgi:Predicted glycosyltransferases
MITSLLILNFNNVKDTINCIESIETFNTAPIKYIVVDNGSSKSGVVEDLHSYFEKRFYGRYSKYDYETEEKPSKLPYLSYVVSKTNDGYARGNNKGLEYAYVDDEINNVLIINNDVLFVQDIIPQLSKALDDIKDCAVLSPLLLKKDGVSIDYNCARLSPSVWQVLMPYFFMYKDFAGVLTRRKKELQILRNNPMLVAESIVPIELPSGSCMMIDKKLMKQVGGFDLNTFLYFEENILFEKFLKLGKKSYLIPKLKCIHLGASTTKKNASTFTLKAGIDSSRYYLENYCHLNVFQRIVMSISYFNMKVKLVIIDVIKCKNLCA